MNVSIPERVLEALKPDLVIWIVAYCHVSIPERVLEALKQIHRAAWGWLSKVSIPERVLEALKRNQFYIEAKGFEFQSLKGF